MPKIKQVIIDSCDCAEILSPDKLNKLCMDVRYADKSPLVQQVVELFKNSKYHEKLTEKYFKKKNKQFSRFVYTIKYLHYIFVTNNERLSDGYKELSAAVKARENTINIALSTYCKNTVEKQEKEEEIHHAEIIIEDTENAEEGAAGINSSFKVDNEEIIIDENVIAINENDTDENLHEKTIHDNQSKVNSEVPNEVIEDDNNIQFKDTNEDVTHYFWNLLKHQRSFLYINFSKIYFYQAMFSFDNECFLYKKKNIIIDYKKNK